MVRFDAAGKLTIEGALKHQTHDDKLCHSQEASPHGRKVERHDHCPQDSPQK
jgi:hypothetical protein